MMNTHTTQRGFTLIELLVVIAIIGILASVVLASLNSARDKGADAAVKSNLNNSRAQAELFYDNHTRSYDAGGGVSVCGTASSDDIGDLVNAAKVAYGGAADAFADGTASAFNTSQCHDSSTAWVAIVPLRSSLAATPVSWCVDSTGASKQVSPAILAVNAMSCP
jgi:prepilin-type N-terminal cleavage/methylation domain-containing protein